MKCSVCERAVSYGAMSLSLINDDAYTINLCHHCRAKLFGAEVDERVRRLVALKGWVQPPLLRSEHFRR